VAHIEHLTGENQMRTQKEKERMIRELARLGFNDVQIAALLRNASTLNRLNQEACSRELRAWAEKKVERCEERVNEIASEIGAIVVHNGDPRGPAFRIFSKETAAALYKPGKKYNNGYEVSMTQQLDEMSHRADAAIW
jgi:hypothetical protein